MEWKVMSIGGVALGAVACSCSQPKPTAAIETQIERAGLWALAPDDARAGVVISPQAARRFERAVEHLAMDAPDLGPATGELLQRPAGAPALSSAARASFFALGNDTPLLEVNPVAVAPESTCREVGELRICSRDAALLEEIIGRKQLPPLAHRVVELPRELRGDIEVAVDLRILPVSPEQQELVDAFMAKLGTWALACDLDDAAIACRARLEGALSLPSFGKSRRSPPRDLRGARAWVTASFNPEWIRGLFAASPLAPSLMRAFDGSVEIVTRGDAIAGGSVFVGLTEDEPTRRALQSACKGVAEDFVDASATNDGCEIQIGLVPTRGPVHLARNEGRATLRIEATARDRALAVHLRGSQQAAFTTPNRPSPQLASLLQQPSHMSFWVRSPDPGWGLDADELARVQAALGGFIAPELRRIGRLALAHVAEAGGILEVTPQHVQMEARVLLVRAGPDAPSRRFHQALLQRVAGAGDRARALLARLAADSPDTNAGRAARMALAGAPALGPLSATALLLGAPEPPASDEPESGPLVTVLPGGNLRIGGRVVDDSFLRTRQAAELLAGEDMVLLERGPGADMERVGHVAELLRPFSVQFGIFLQQPPEAP